MSEQIPTIPQFFSKRNIFITGGTGLLGKTLIEKLLRSCPDIGLIYMLIRPKHGKSLDQRVSNLLNNPLFDLLREQQPLFREKLIPIEGEIAKINLGLSGTDRTRIINDVTVIFHVGASVRFDDPLQYAILVNTRSTRDLINLAKEIKNLAVFEYISTCYSNADKKIIEERIYPPSGNWEEAIMIAENGDKDTLNIFTQKYINHVPNTYIYTKRLTENLIEDSCRGSIPTVVFRPAVVISTYEDPFPGFNDNLNGPVGLLIAGGTGLCRQMYGNVNCRIEFVFLDTIVKSIIVSAWKKAIDITDRQKITVYNGSRDLDTPAYVGHLLTDYLVFKEPLERKIWIPNITRKTFTACWYNFYLSVMLIQVLPAIFIDLLLRIINKKPMILKLQRKIYTAVTNLSPFTLNEWLIKNEHFKKLDNDILDADVKDFSYYHLCKLPASSAQEYVLKSCSFVRWYLLKEPKIVKRRTIIIAKWWFALHISLYYSFIGFVLWFIFVKHDMALKIVNSIMNYLHELS